MRFSETAVQGAQIIQIDRITDDRGFFARVWCQDEFARHGIKASWAQANVGHSIRTGTLRGMHYQRDPRAEAKLVRCTRGAVYDVALDLRPASPSYLRWVGATLDADEHIMLYIPEGCGHGYLTSAPNTDLVYQASVPYAPGSATGVRYDDPVFNIAWPGAVSVISVQDRNWPSLSA